MINTSLPTLPTVPNNGRGRLVADIPITGPVMKQVVLGTIPADYMDDNEAGDGQHTPCSGDACSLTQGQKVVVTQPELQANGQAVLTQQQFHVDAAAETVKHGACKGGVIGALAGLLPGVAAAAASLVSPLAAAGLVAAGTALGAAIGAHHAQGDHIRLKWQQEPVTYHTLTGYDQSVVDVTHTVRIGKVTQTIHDGWRHEFTPAFSDRPVGSYWQPVVEHYRIASAH